MKIYHSPPDVFNVLQILNFTETTLLNLPGGGEENIPDTPDLICPNARYMSENKKRVQWKTGEHGHFLREL